MRHLAILLLLVVSVPSLTGCGGTKHVVHGPGSKGVILEPLKAPKAAMVDDAGKLDVGPVELPAGTLFKVPSSGEDIRKELGVQTHNGKKLLTNEENGAITYGPAPKK